MSPTASSFYVTGGTLRQDAPSYVERQADKDLYVGLLRGEYCYVLHARQMGKSSLMVHTTARLRQEGVAVAAFELTALGQNLTVEQWYDGLLSRIGRELDLEDELEDYWLEHERLAPLQRWMGAVEHVILARCAGRIVLFLDEIDAVRSLPFSTDEFFAAIRECYNRRSQEAQWGRLTFCLLGVATPSDLIQDTRTTPFNIGKRIELTDFTPAEAAPLAQGLGREPKSSEALLHRVLHWTSGHPYLTQRLCQAVAQDETVTDPAGVDRHCEALFLSPQAQERDDNLLFVRERLLKSEADRASLLDLYSQVRSGKRVRLDDTNQLVSLLRLSGITRVGAPPRRAPLRRSGRGHGSLRVRNRIYERVFDPAWITQHMPDAELRRQRAAYQQGLLRAGATAAVIVVVVGMLAVIAVQEARRASRSEKVAKRSELQATRLAEDRRRYLYAAQTNLAQQAYEAGNLGRALRLLQAQRPAPGQEELRGFEWRYLWRLCQGDSLRTFRGHTDRVSAVAFSPDGKLLATVSDDKTLRLWEVTGTKPPIVLGRQTQRLNALAWSPDGRLLATGSGSNTHSDEGVPGAVTLWDVASRRVVGSLAGHRSLVHAVTFSPDGKLLATCSDDNTVRLWDVGARREIGRLQAGPGGVWSVVFSPDGQRVAAISINGSIQIWDIYTHKEIMSLGPRNGSAWSIAFSPRGRLLAASDSQHEVLLWDLARKRRVGTLRGNQGAIMSLAFAPDGRTLAAGGVDSNVRLWDVPGALAHSPAAPRTTLRGHTDVVWSVRFSPDGQWLASGSSDGTAKLWSPFALRSRPRRATGQERATFWTRCLSPTGRMLAVGCVNGTVELWDTSNRTRLGLLKQGPDEITGLAFSRDSKLLEVLAGFSDRPAVHQTVKLWDVATQREIAALRKLPTGVDTVALSPDGRTLGLGCRDHTARLWDLATGNEVAILRGHTESGIIAFSPNGRFLATGGPDEPARLWSLGPPGKDGAPRAVQQTATLRGHKGWRDDLAFSPDSRTLVTTGLDKTVRLWDVATGREQAILEGHASETLGIAFSPDGRTLAISSHDGAVKLWNLAAHQEVVTLQGHGVIPTLAFSPDGNLLTASSLDTRIQQWRAAPFAETDAPATAYQTVR